MNHPDYTAEQRKCLDFAGKKFTASSFGYVYQWQAEKWIGARNNDQRPFLMAKPVRRISGKQGTLARMVAWHADNLPEKPDDPC